MDQLKQLGFHKNEIKIYLALFELGKVKAGEVIENTGLHRNIVYTSLEELVKRGLVTKTIVKGVAKYVANEPENLVREVEQKKQVAEQVAKELKKKQEEIPREITVHEGIEGIKRVRNKSLLLEEGETVYVLGGSKVSSVPELEKYWRDYHKKRIAKGINQKILFDKATNQEVLDWRNKMEKTEARYLPFNADMPVWFGIWKDSVDIGIPGDNPLDFSIRSKETADGLKKYFEYFWNQEVVMETGLKALERFIYEMLDELNPGEEYFVLGASVGVENDPGQKLYDKFHKDRVEKGVFTNMLVYHESYDLIKKRFERSGDPEGKISHLKKFISAPPSPMQINMYNGKTRLVIYGKEPTIIYFDKPEIYQGFKNYFDALWNQDTIVVKGFEELKKVLDSNLSNMKKGERYDVLGAGYGPKGCEEKYINFFADFNRDRIKAGFQARLLFHHDVKDRVEVNKELYETKTEVRYLLYKAHSPVATMIFKEDVVMIVQREEPTTIVIKDPDVAQVYQKHFDSMWGKG